MITNKKERIPVILEVYSPMEVKDKFLEYLFPSMNKITINEYIKTWIKKEEDIKSYWEENPHLKFLHVLNLKILLPELLNFYYYDKADEFLMNLLLTRAKQTPLFDESLYDID